LTGQPPANAPGSVNLAANKTPAIRRWARCENVELCFTPTNASWANPIEAQFGPVRTFVMGNSDHRHHPALARKLQAYLRWRNAHAAAPTSWPSSAANALVSGANASNAGAGSGRKPRENLAETCRSSGPGIARLLPLSRPPRTSALGP
jgi:hypothetical protein